MRPATLAEVARMTASGDSFDHCLANFLDGFYASPSADALALPPTLLAPTVGEAGRVQDSYLAATAEELARREGFPAPAWTASEDRKLHHPWFALPLSSLKTTLLLESPAAFRSRNLFVSENALARA